MSALSIIRNSKKSSAPPMSIFKSPGLEIREHILSLDRPGGQEAINSIRDTVRFMIANSGACKGIDGEVAVLDLAAELGAWLSALQDDFADRKPS
ncbi:hypothetical protein FHR71_001759 [Methylobacterium sp. RAS18]|nr:hypothetical protein [Methylobacterium sp. RAS18]